MVSLRLWSEVYVKHVLMTIQQKLGWDLGWKCMFSENSHSCNHSAVLTLGPWLAVVSLGPNELELYLHSYRYAFNAFRIEGLAGLASLLAAIAQRLCWPSLAHWHWYVDVA